MSRSSRERPLWLRWVLAVGAFSLLSAVIVLVVHAVNHSGGATSDVQAARQASRQSQALIAQDQLPRTAPLARRARPDVALAAAITSDVRAQVNAHSLAGPVGAVSCRPRTRGHARRLPYRCVVGAAAVSYLFYAVVDLGAGRLQWCRQDQVPAGLAVPIDPGCLA